MCDDENSTINNTNSDGGFLEISDPKNSSENLLPVFKSHNHSHKGTKTKTQRPGSGLISRWIKYHLLNTETKRYAWSKSKSGGIL